MRHLSRVFHLFVALTLALVLLAVVGTGPALAETHTGVYVSGNGPDAGADPLVEFSKNSGPWTAARIVAGYPASQTIPGAQWVSTVNGGHDGCNCQISYRFSFTLPTGYSNAALTVTWHADEWATIRIGSQAGTKNLFQNGPTTQTLNSPEYFNTGVNEVQFVGLNEGGHAGINFRATVTYETNVAPSAEANGPYSVGEGGSVQLSASGSDLDGDALSYTWDLDNNGGYETTGQNPTFSAATVNAGETRTVGLRVCDTAGACATDTATVTATDVQATVDVDLVASPSTISEGGVGSQSVTYTYTVRNTSPASTDTLRIVALTDENESPLGTSGCETGAVLGAGASCSFTVTRTLPAADAGATHSSTVNVVAFDDEAPTGGSLIEQALALALAAKDSASATVTYADVAPSASLTYASPLVLQEGGVGAHGLAITYTVTNTSLASTDPLRGLILLDLNGNPLIADGGTCLTIFGTGGSLLPGASCTFAIARTAPAGNAGTAPFEEGGVIVALDDGDIDLVDGVDVFLRATPSVTYADVAPAIAVSTTVGPTSVPEGGVAPQTVTYTFTATNTSAASTDAVVLQSLTDSALGPLAGSATCRVGTQLEPGASCGFTVTTTPPVLDAGATHGNTFTATANDDEGSSASASASATVTYANVAPTVSLTGAAIVENGVASVTATLADAATTDTCTLTVDWGEGAPQSQAVACNGPVALTHQYLDDNPSGTPSDTYTVKVTVRDDDGSEATAQAAVQVDDVAPTVNAGADQVTHFGGTVSLAVGLADPGTKDTFTYTLDWGDGSPIATGMASAGPAAIVLSHQYLTPGAKTVTACVRDDDGLQGCDTLVVTVANGQGKVTGPGFNAHSDAKGLKGELQWKQGSTQLHASTLTAFGVSSDKRRAWLAYTGRGGESILLYVEDNGEPGRNDVFRLTVDGVPQTTGSGQLTGGNVQIH